MDCKSGSGVVFPSRVLENISEQKLCMHMKLGIINLYDISLVCYFIKGISDLSLRWLVDRCSCIAIYAWRF